MAIATAKLLTPRGNKSRKGASTSMARRTVKRDFRTDDPDFATLASDHRGMFRGPRDLSTREGYGR